MGIDGKTYGVDGVRLGNEDAAHVRLRRRKDAALRLLRKRNSNVGRG